MSDILEIVALPPPPPRSAGFHGPQPYSVGVRKYTTTTEAIANFKPTSREVISGIAPHVFDERKRRRSQKRANRPYWYGPHGEKRSSPLRGATVIAWDEHSIYLEQPDMQVQRATDTEKHESVPRREDVSDHDCPQTMGIKRPVKLDKPRWRYFRVDRQLFKILKLKLATSLTTSSSNKAS